MCVYTHKWSCRLNALPHIVHTYFLSSLCVSLCFVSADALLNTLPQTCRQKPYRVSQPVFVLTSANPDSRLNWLFMPSQSTRGLRVVRVFVFTRNCFHTSSCSTRCEENVFRRPRNNLFQREFT